jgi:hypothetical protein
MEAAEFGTQVWSFGVAHSKKRVSRKEFMRGYTHIIKSRSARAKLCETIEELLGGCFDLFDAENRGQRTGSMNKPQFIDYVTCWNLSEAEAEQLFVDIVKLECTPSLGVDIADGRRKGLQDVGEGDCQEDEQITRQQYLNAAWDFYFSMDDVPSAGMNFYGSLRQRKQHLTF